MPRKDGPHPVSHVQFDSQDILVSYRHSRYHRTLGSRSYNDGTVLVLATPSRKNP